MKRIVFCDMDGVLADFHAGALRLCGKPPLTTAVCRQMGKFQLPYSMEEVTGRRDIWEFIRDAGSAFWADLEPTPWAYDLMALLRSVDRKLTILTSPGSTAASYACVGKIAWLKQHFDIDPRHVIFASRKHLLAAPGRILVDDMQEHCDEWTTAGGHAVLIPQPWNSGWERTAEDVVEGVKAALAA
jgi:5'(3')-deoxyribonucleotidase